MKNLFLTVINFFLTLFGFEPYALDGETKSISSSNRKNIANSYSNSVFEVNSYSTSNESENEDSADVDQNDVFYNMRKDNGVSDKLRDDVYSEGYYKSHPEAVVIACYYNPTKNPYRKMCFDKFYQTIKHLNHRIIECKMGADSEYELDDNLPNLTRVQSKDVLWHKETLLNKLVKDLPDNIKYVFWIDADVVFTNPDWFYQGAEALKHSDIIQPFEYCIHLEQDEIEPDFDVDFEKMMISDRQSIVSGKRNPRFWQSFSATIVKDPAKGRDNHYDVHGHVGFAWGATREVLEAVPLYDKALVGGADHIIAHAAVGQIPSQCIDKSFSEELDEIYSWSEEFYKVVNGNINFVEGDLWHIWHGDLEARKYLSRIQEFTGKSKHINSRDENGFHVAGNIAHSQYVENYLRERESIEDKETRKQRQRRKQEEEQKRKREQENQRKRREEEQSRLNRSSYNSFDNTDDRRYRYTEDTNDSLLEDAASVLLANEVLNSSNNSSNSINQETGQDQWGGFGGGGDFSGGGAGGGWSENDNTDQNNFAASSEFSKTENNYDGNFAASSGLSETSNYESTSEGASAGISVSDSYADSSNFS